MNLFQIVLNKLNIIHPKIESQKNYKLKNLIEEFKHNLINPSYHPVKYSFNILCLNLSLNKFFYIIVLHLTISLSLSNWDRNYP